MAKKFTLSVKTNRIYFERYEAPCGEPEDNEIRQAWESAAILAIEAAGYDCEVDVGVGGDPAVRWHLGYDGNWFDWSTGPRMDDERIGNPIDELCEECADEAARDLWRAILPILRRDAARVADDAISSAADAAEQLSAEFVRQSARNREVEV